MSEDTAESIDSDDNFEETQQGELELIDDPVLCYVSSMYGKRPDHLICQVIGAFYSDLEVETAKKKLVSDADDFIADLAATFKANHRYTHAKKGTDCSDILAIYAHVNSKNSVDKLPTYVTSNVLRIPCDDPNNQDPRVLQSEVKLLRNELSRLSKTCEEKFSQQQVQLEQLNARDDHKDRNEAIRTNTTVAPLVQTTHASTEQRDDLEFNLSEDTTGEPELMESKTGEPRVMGFFGQKSPLSNFHKCPVEIFGIKFRTSEHAYQYTKAIFCNEKEIATSVVEAQTPGSAKHLGDKIDMSPYKREKWNMLAAENMEAILIQKFKQNPNLLEYLVKTGDQILAEASYDKIWGCGILLPDPCLHDISKWKGANLLGQLMMKVRSELSNYQGSEGNADMVFDLPVYTAIIDTEVPTQSKEPKASKGSQSFADTLKTPGVWGVKDTLKKKKLQGISPSRVTTGKKLTGVKKAALIDYYVGQLEDDTTTDDVKVWCDGSGVKLAKCFELTSAHPDTKAFRIRCAAFHSDTLMDPNFWPDNVVIHEWVRKVKTVTSSLNHG